MSEKKELYDKLNALNRKDKLNEAEEAEYGRLWSSAIRFPLGEILKGSRYENMSLNEIGFNDKMVSLLSEKGIMNASDLLSLDRLTADLTPAKWRKIMEKKDVIIGYLPKNYLERWLDEDPTLEPLPVPVNNEDIQAFITLPAYFDLKSIQEIKLDNVRELIDSIGNKLFNILLNNGIYLLSGIFNITQNDNIKGGGKRFNEQLEDLKKDVIEDTSKWINANTCSLRDQEIHIFPSSDCTDDTCSQLISAIKEIYDYISSNQNIKTSQYDLQYLKWRYIDNLPKEEIISKLLETSTNQKSAEQNERNYRKSVISKLLGTDGVYLASNVRLSETLLDELRTISKRILWRPVSDLLDVYNIPIESAKVSIFMDLMGIDTYTYDPQSLRNSFFVNIGDSKGNYDDFVKNIKDFLKTQPLPLSKQAIFDSYHSNINNIFEDEEILLETVLATHPDIELVELDGDCLYQIKYNCLANSGLKIVRIIYEEKRTLSYDEINQMDRSRNPSGKEINAAHSKIDPQYSDIVISPRAGYLCYNTGGIQTFSHSIVLDFIQSYGSNHESSLSMK